MSGEILESLQPQRPTLVLIAQAVAAQFGLTVAQLRSSQRRHRAIARPRQIAMFLMRTEAEGSFPRIGKFFKMDHTSILHGCRNITDLIDTDPNVRAVVLTLRARITAALSGRIDMDTIECPNCSVLRAQLADIQTTLDALRSRMGGCGD